MERTPLAEPHKLLDIQQSVSESASEAHRSLLAALPVDVAAATFDTVAELADWP